MTNTPHTSGDSVAAPTISDERLQYFALMHESNASACRYHGIDDTYSADLANCLRELQRLRSASAAPAEGVALPKITQEHWQSYGGPVLLMEFDRDSGWQWTQIAVDFASVLKCAPAAPPSVEAPTGEKVCETCGGDRAIEVKTHDSERFDSPCPDCAPAAEASATREGPRATDDQRTLELWHQYATSGAPPASGYAIRYDEFRALMAALRTDTAPTCGVTITEDEREALEAGAECMIYRGRDYYTLEEQVRHAATLRSLAARMSKGERG